MTYEKALNLARKACNRYQKAMVVVKHENGEHTISSVENWQDPSRIDESIDYWERWHQVKMVSPQQI